MEDNRYRVGNRILSGVVIVDDAGNLVSSFGQSLPSSIGNGEKDVATSGSAVPLVATSTSCVDVLIQSKNDNTGNIYVGGGSVSSSNGVCLYPSESIAINIDNLDEIYIDSSVSGEGVVFTYTS
jgi:hypothetical protein